MPKTHGCSRTPMHKLWTRIKNRCSPSYQAHHRYAGRGINICDRWSASYENFSTDILAEIGPRPSPLHSIDRKDNDGNYEPGNIKWSTPTEQQNNLSTNRLIAAFGKTQTVSQWARELGVPRVSIYARLNRGYLPEDCLSVEGFPRFIPSIRRQQQGASQ